MGITIHYQFYCKDKECVKRAIDETYNAALEMKKKFPGVQILKRTDHELEISPHPDSELIELNFEPYSEKEQRFKKENWDYEYSMLTEREYVDSNGNPYDPYHGKPGVSFREKFKEPKFGRDGLQTAAFTKTQYAGAEGHVIACKILDTIRKNTDKHVIDDEAEYCGDGDKWDHGKLLDSMEANLQVIQAMMGQLESLGYGDQIGGSAPEYLKKLKAVKK